MITYLYNHFVAEPPVSPPVCSDGGGYCYSVERDVCHYLRIYEEAHRLFSVGINQRYGNACYDYRS